MRDGRAMLVEHASGDRATGVDGERAEVRVLAFGDRHFLAGGDEAGTGDGQLVRARCSGNLEHAVLRDKWHRSRVVERDRERGGRLAVRELDLADRAAIAGGDDL